jgi:glycosyltransferase involved in cell wall biosynthesis
VFSPSKKALTTIATHTPADYNGSWLLTSDRRARYLYAMFNLHMTPDTRRCCEHQGRFDMLRIVVAYMLREQAGLGVVAVSPLYAPRMHQKFSQFWPVPLNRLRGILNGVLLLLCVPACRLQHLVSAGIDPAERPIPLPDDMQVLFNAKAEAKRAWQKANGLTVDPEARVFSFLGRMTHQKGCDLIVIAAENVMNKYPKAQLAMAGPVGDEFGEKARLGVDMLAAKFPGRVLNAAGQYVRGAEKEQLIMVRVHTL